VDTLRRTLARTRTAGGGLLGRRIRKIIRVDMDALCAPSNGADARTRQTVGLRKERPSL
jgi:hypothetical protein